MEGARETQSPSLGRIKKSDFFIYKKTHNFPSGVRRVFCDIGLVLYPPPPHIRVAFKNQTREDQRRFHSLWLSSSVAFDHLLNLLRFCFNSIRAAGLHSQYHIHKLDKIDANKL